MKNIVMFILKSVAFSILFWTVGGLLFFSVSYIIQGSYSTATGNENNEFLMQKYKEQVAQTDKLQTQSAIALNKQAELLDRWEKVIQKWERQRSK